MISWPLAIVLVVTVVTVAIVTVHYIDYRRQVVETKMEQQHEMVMSVEEQYDAIDMELRADNVADDWDNLMFHEKLAIMKAVKEGTDDEPDGPYPVMGFTDEQIEELQEA